ncbi:hypothetical protein [Cetobacterium sp.]
MYKIKKNWIFQFFFIL